MSLYEITFPVYGHGPRDIEALLTEMVEADSAAAAEAMFPGVEVLAVCEALPADPRRRLDPATGEITDPEVER